MIEISVVVPIYNEIENLPIIFTRLNKVVCNMSSSHEIIFVDDGSTDESEAKIREFCSADRHVKLLSFSRNFGHQQAITAGLRASRGQAVFVMDGDLQDRPEDLMKLYSEMSQGFDVVFATRVNRKESLSMRLCYFLAYRIIRTISEEDLPIDSGDFCVMSRRVVNHINSFEERGRYVRGLRALVGFRQKGIEIERGERLEGEPKYTFRRLLNLALDGVFSFSFLPIRLCWLVGIFFLFLTVIFLLYAVFMRLFTSFSPTGFTALTVLIVFLSGINLFFIGIVGEYSARIFQEVRRRPMYIIKSSQNFRDDDDCHSM